MFLLLFLTALVEPKEPTDYKNIDLGLTWVMEKTESSGFIVGGKNETVLLKTLKELNGRSIEDLEKDMRPGAKVDVGSEKGFLGAKESLREILATDNAYIIDELGLTHQLLARHLRSLAAIAEKDKEESFVYHGRKFKATVQLSRGIQLSPFRDGTKTNQFVRIENVATGKKLGFSPLVADMVERYGFYEGKGTPYRMDPKEVLSVLDFIKPTK
jgi:hypothetical protein